MNACLFCGAEGSGILTKEHVIPQWLLSHLQLPPDDELFQGVADSATGELIQNRVHATSSFVQGRVCERCNGGWMSRLEEAAKPILIPLIDGTRPVNEMAVAERTIVSKWTAKTAYLHTWAGPLKQPVQLQHLHALSGDDGVIVPGVVVLAMQDDHVKPSSYLQTGQWAHTGLGAAAETDPGAYTVGLQFGRLYLMTAFWPGSNHRFMVTPAHIRLWPPAAEWMVYEGWMTKDPGLNPMVPFAGELGLFHMLA